jgi:transcriptional regulatory protein RtcR
LKERPEDIEPNLQFEIDQFARKTGRQITFSNEARRKFLAFALSPAAEWKGNFRDLNAALSRMATLSLGGRISEEIVAEEIERLDQSWRPRAPVRSSENALAALFTDTRLEDLDLFDRVQLAGVLDVCRRSTSLAAAGRELFNASRLRRSSTNDSDRLRKYLARFGLDWEQVSDRFCAD